MISYILKISKLLPLLKIEFYFKQNCFYLKREFLYVVTKILKYHYRYDFKLLTLICALDFLKNKNRFKLVYELLSLKFNIRIRLKVLTDEVLAVNSIQNIFISANWWEAECWDMYGVIFKKNQNVIRLLTDYGFQGYPLRKDFPLTGFTETRYNLTKNRIVYHYLELSQNFRMFVFKSPWDIG